MSINPFSNLFKKQTPIENTNFLSIALTPNKISACIWLFAEEKVQMLGIASKSFTNIDSLIHEAAVAIDNAGKMAKSDVSKVVFGLSSSYFEGKSLSVETGAILKNLASELDLEAEAYISLASSISHYLKIKESVTPQAILIGSLGDFTEVHLIKNNQVIKTKTSKSPASVEKIRLLLEQIKTEEGQDLPSRILVYGAVEDSHLGKEIQKGQWENIFVNTPKVDFLDEEQIVEAVVYSQAADILGHDPVLIPTTGEKTHSHETEKLPSLEETLQEKAVSKKTEVDEMGFIEGEDILKAEKLETEAPKPTQITPAAKETVGNVQEYAVEDNKQEMHAETPFVSNPQQPTRKRKSIIERITTVSYLPNLFGLTRGQKSRKTIIIFLLGIFFAAVICAYIASLTLTSAKIIIRANTQSQQDDFKVAVLRGGILDVSNETIAGEEIISSADGSQKTVTTGTKNVGNYAKGKVKVLNWTTSERKFPKGTVIISNSGIKFTLDSDIEVASRSASLPGESQVDVTAQDFGPSGNLNGGTDFTFQQFDELLYSAKNNDAFTGGDEKQVTVVSQEDVDKLSKSLLDSLTEKAKVAIREKSSDKKLNDDAIKITVTKKQFDHKLNDEAALLTLDMSIEAKAIVYNEDSLKDLISQTINQGANENLEARPENIQLTQVTSKVDSNGLILTGKYNADLVPKFDDDQLKGKIAGKSIKEAGAIIKQIPQVADVDFEFSPKLFIFLSVPRNKSKITFKIERAG